MVLAGLSVLLQLWKELIIFPLESSLALASNNLWIVIMSAIHRIQVPVTLVVMVDL